MKIKVFVGRVTAFDDLDSIESKVNSFIQGKKVIDIKQSASPYTGTNGLSILTITVMYEN